MKIHSHDSFCPGAGRKPAAVVTGRLRKGQAGGGKAMRAATGHQAGGRRKSDIDSEAGSEGR